VTSGAGAAGGAVEAGADSGTWAKALVKAYNTAAAVKEATVLVMQILPELSSSDEVATTPGPTNARPVPQREENNTYSFQENTG
jgi:hypothetical protein